MSSRKNPKSLLKKVREPLPLVAARNRRSERTATYRAATKGSGVFQQAPEEPRASARGAHERSIDPRYACFAMRVGNSGIHRLGVYAAQHIPANRKVIEYTGEKINRKETKIRVGRRLNYIFTLDNYWCIDGGVGGSGAEFINHSCQPNLTTQIRKGHILYYSNRKIRKGEELLVDYHFPFEVQTVRCKCGAKNCRGTINHLKSKILQRHT